MSNISRVIKAGSGTDDWVPHTTILSHEANTDLNTIYDNYNGFIDSTNIAAHSVTYDRLNLTNGIVNADINTAAGIVGTKLANDTITPVQVATTGYGTGNCVTGVTVVINTPQILASATITTTGGPVLLLGSCSVSALSAGLGSPDAVSWTWKRGATIVWVQIVDIQTPPTVPVCLLPLSIPIAVDPTVAAGTYTYTLTIQATVGLQTAPAFAGAIQVKELLG